MWWRGTANWAELYTCIFSWLVAACSTSEPEKPEQYKNLYFENEKLELIAQDTYSIIPGYGSFEKKKEYWTF